jgi:hypothetical protein
VGLKDVLGLCFLAECTIDKGLDQQSGRFHERVMTDIEGQ